MARANDQEITVDILPTFVRPETFHSDSGHSKLALVGESLAILVIRSGL
jgi:hypothetical protein